MSEERATVLYCPYCGEEDLRPAEAHLAQFPAAWACGACRRAFTVRALGPAAAPTMQSAGSSTRSPSQTSPVEPEAAL